MKKNLLISTGGTGGHVIPALTFYDHLKNHFNVSISTDQRGTKFINDTYFYDVIYTPKINSNLFLYPIKLFLLFITIVKSLLFLKKKKINLVLSTGGYMSFPMCISAKLLGIDIILFEPNTIIGRTNLFILKFAKRVLCYSSNISNFPNKYKNKIYEIEPVIRKSHYVSKKNTRCNFVDKINIVILGGSQGAEFFDNFILKLVQNLAKKVKLNILQQVNNKKNIYNIEKFYKDTNLEFKLFTYNEDLHKILGNYNLAFTRCGASSMAELTQYNIPFIGIPLPHAKDDHQYLNAKHYESKNCCWIFRQEELSIEKIEKLIQSIFADNNIYKEKFDSMVNLSYKNNWDNINKKLIDLFNEN